MARILGGLGVLCPQYPGRVTLVDTRLCYPLTPISRNRNLGEWTGPFRFVRSWDSETERGGGSKYSKWLIERLWHAIETPTRRDPHLPPSLTGASRDKNQLYENGAAKRLGREEQTGGCMSLLGIRLVSDSLLLGSLYHKGTIFEYGSGGQLSYPIGSSHES